MLNGMNPPNVPVDFFPMRKPFIRNRMVFPPKPVDNSGKIVENSNHLWITLHRPGEFASNPLKATPHIWGIRLF